VQRQTRGGSILMGGGTDVDEAFVWLISNSGGGDILVLRASGTDAYNSYIYGLGKVNSVASLIFSSKVASSDPFVLGKINNCEGLFFAGGDQSVYYSYWKNTAVETAVNNLIQQKRVTVGGTSAGMVIQSQIVYTAVSSSVTSDEALADPYTSGISFGEDLIEQPFLKNVITDSHFYNRDRMGRLVTFIARMLQDRYVSGTAYGIACDESTALLVSDSGVGRVVNPSSGPLGLCYFLSASGLPNVCRSGQPLDFDDVDVYALEDDDTFDLVSWYTSNGRRYSLSAYDKSLSSAGNNGRIY